MATKKPSPAEPPPEPTIGELIDKANDIREKRRALAAEDKPLETEYNELSLRIIAALDKQGTKSGSSARTTASISEAVVANVMDWDKFWALIIKHQLTQLLQHRVSDPAYRELLKLAETDKKLAKALAAGGVESFTKRSLNLRNNSSK